MKYRVVGESRDCQLFVGFEGNPECGATHADIIACLRANPEACAEVLVGLEPTCCKDSRANLLARAEQAERERDEAKRSLADALASRAAIDAHVSTLVRERDELREALTRIQTVVAPKLTKQLPVAGVANEVIRLHSDFMLMQRERDEARAEVSEWHALSEAVGFAHEPDTGPVVVDAAAREAFAEWTVRARRAESDAFELTVERDAAESRADRFRAALRDSVARLNTGAGMTPAASDEFHCRAPQEIGHCVTALRLERDAALAKIGAEREAQDRETAVLTQRAESIAHDHAKAVAERDEALVRLALLADLFRAHQIEGDESLGDVVARRGA